MSVQQRMRYLDGLRGLAISMVVLFHLVPHWASLIPWPSQYAQFWPARYGYLGVQLFFLLSGYLIAHSVVHCEGFVHFMAKRWLRLFPAMALASVLLLLTAPWLSERPQGQPALRDALAGLLFVHPFFFEKFFGLSLVPLEWAYWSLFVEVIFYAVFGALYYLRRSFALWGLGIIYLASASYKLLTHLQVMDSLVMADKFIDACFIHFGWFFLGAFAQAQGTGDRVKHHVIVSTMLALVIATTVGFDLGAALMCLALYALFSSVLHFEQMRRLLSVQWIVFLGYVSYPLYLIHENALVAMTLKVHRLWPEAPLLLTPIPGLAILLCIAWLMARYGEPKIKAWLAKLLGARFSAGQ